MRVSVAATGSFHIFDLARQMLRLGHLSGLYTGFPRWKIDGLPAGKVHNFPWLVTPLNALTHLGLFHLASALSWPAIDTFDRWLASRLEPCEVFHCLPSFGLRAQRAAKQRYGALTVFDGGSTHIVFQDEILADEYARWGVPYTRIDRRLVDRVLQEYAECDLITAASSFVYRSCIEKGIPKEKLVKLPYGVDLRLFRPIPKNDDVFRVIFVGQLSLRKGILYLLEALRPLRLPKFEVWAIGSVMPDTKQLLGNYDNVRFVGVIPRTELFQYYSQGSVFVLPSIEEGLALVQAQAMACGLPVIATTNTGGEDIFTDGEEGFIVPIRDPEAIREKVIYLYENPDKRASMSEAVLSRVRSLGGWDRYGEQAAACYYSALSSMRSAG